MKKIILGLVFLGLVISCNNEEPDPCENVSCLNGGSCVNGVCDCSEEFTGPDCSRQKTPSSIDIANVRVTEFPATEPDGTSWDFSLTGDGRADIYVVVSFGTSVIYDSPTFFENANSSQDYDFEPSSGIRLTNPTERRYTVALYDYDSGGDDDFMGAIEFTPYSDDNGFPSTLFLDAGGTVSFELQVTYNF